MSASRWTALALFALAVLTGAVLLLSAETAAGSTAARGTPGLRNFPTTGPGTATVVPSPTSAPPGFITNLAGEPVSFVIASGAGPLTGATGPGTCGTPAYFGINALNFPSGMFYMEAYWLTKCIEPLGKMTLSWDLFIGPDKIHNYMFLPEIPAETYSNNDSLSATGLVITAVSLGEPFVVEQPAGCSAPSYDFEGPMLAVGNITITWPSACILPGDNAVVHLAGAAPAESHVWLVATPTPTLTPTPTVTPTKQPDPGDTDLDGCTDQAENGPNAGSGGLRNYTYFWDFYDVWTRPAGDPNGWERNRAINILDVLGVALRFGPGPGPVSKAQVLADALTPPVSANGYHAAYDRGAVIGANSWDRAPADGTISVVNDVLGVATQFGHNCT